MRRWVDTWKKAGPELERIREEEVRNENTIRAFEVFEGLALLELEKRPPEPYSGLVEQQRWFRLAAMQNPALEEFIILKALGNQDADWKYIEAKLKQPGVETLNWNYILEQLETLAISKEEPDIMPRLELLCQKARRSAKD